LSKRFQVDGQRFLVKVPPKTREHRQLRLSKQIVSKIEARIEAATSGPMTWCSQSEASRGGGRRGIQTYEVGQRIKRQGRHYRHGRRLPTGWANAVPALQSACAIHPNAAPMQGQPSPARALTTDGHIRGRGSGQHLRSARNRAELDSRCVHDLRHRMPPALAGGARTTTSSMPRGRDHYPEEIVRDGHTCRA
jgi:hypothetical protein